MNDLLLLGVIIPFVILFAGCSQSGDMHIEVYETSESGNKLTRLEKFPSADRIVNVTLTPNSTFQEITGIGGSFTEASAYVLNQLSEENKNKILEAYFGDSGARYSLTRTHMNSSDFSLGNYSYAPVPGDLKLENFSIEEDRDDIIPMIKDAMELSTDGFKIIASPWTAPPWMKDNKDWRGGKLLPEYYDTWALFFSKYLQAYRDEGIDIWGVTIENEPLGNDSNWESMHYTPEEQNKFVKNHLGPKLEKKWPEVKLLGYDQNRHEELVEWVDVMFGDEEAAKYYDGTAVHWYASTFNVFADELQYAHQKAPNKYLIQTEATVDAEVPVWQDDSWYWSKEATDWGWDWAPDDRKPLHPKYVPVFRYARDIIGTLNNWVDGWIDWNMVLNKQGGPNWAQNWCVAPIIVDPKLDEVYFTPLYYTMAQFSRFIRPGSRRIGFEMNADEELMLTAVENPDESIAMVLLNQSEKVKGIELNLNGHKASFGIQGKAIQTVVISKNDRSDMK